MFTRFSQPLPLRVLLPLLAVILSLGTGGFLLGKIAERPTQREARANRPLPTSPPATTVTALPTATATGMPSTPLAVTPTIVPTQRPTAAVTEQPLLLGYDVFDRSTDSGWGTATDGQLWQGDAQNGSGFAVEDQAGTIEGKASWNALLGPSATNAEVTLTGSIEDFAGGRNNFGAVLRWSDATHWYKALLNGTSLMLTKQNGATQTLLCSVPFLAIGSVAYTIRFQALGTQLFVRAWLSALPEVPFWQISVHDSTLDSGHAGLRVLLQDDTSEVDITHFLAKKV